MNRARAAQSGPVVDVAGEVGLELGSAPFGSCAIDREGACHVSGA